jgi:hypothetical protein
VSEPSPLKRREIIEALRSGTVPRRGLELFSVGLERFEKAIDEELDSVAAGNAKFKAVQGEYGAGKTFFSRWLEHRARAKGFATAQVQISETETPLYRMETVYRRAVEGLQTSEWNEGAFHALLERWFFSLEDEVLAAGQCNAQDPEAVAEAVGQLLERRLADVSATQPEFAAALRACHTARVRGDHATAEGLVAWLMGNPTVGAGIKRAADLKGEIDHFGAGGFLRGLLEVLKQTERKGLVLVLDELETIQRVRRESREKSLNALRQLIDEVANQRFPGLYILITGTPAFFESSRGIGGLDALAQRLHVDFGKETRFDSARAVRIRLPPFDRDKLLRVGARIRELYPTNDRERIETRLSDPVLGALVDRVAGQLGQKIGVVPRIFLKRLVAVLDKVDEHPDYDPAEHEDFTIDPHEMTAEERLSAGVVRSVDDINLDISDSTDTGERGSLE